MKGKNHRLLIGHESLKIILFSLSMDTVVNVKNQHPYFFLEDGILKRVNFVEEEGRTQYLVLFSLVFLVCILFSLGSSRLKGSKWDLTKEE